MVPFCHVMRRCRFWTVRVSAVTPRNLSCGNGHFGNSHCALDEIVIARAHPGQAAAEADVMALQESPPVHDEVLDALDNFVVALEMNAARNTLALERARQFRRMREEGLSYADIVACETRPLIVELATSNIEALYDAGGRFRRAEAQALHSEGMTMDRIACLFGVTRQRVSALLRQTRSARSAARRTLPASSRNG